MPQSSGADSSPPVGFEEPRCSPRGVLLCQAPAAGDMESYKGAGASTATLSPTAMLPPSMTSA